MNFIFVSPHFPKTYWNFCDRLHRNGVNVLGIGDAPFDEIPWELKNCLTEYYRVDNLGNYNEMLRAVAYFTFHYGKIDWIESNNEYWLEMDAQLRTDFNITTGAQNDFIERITKMATVLGDDIITTTQSHRPYKLPNTQNVAMMVAEDMCKK